jgi:tRNA(Ile)-lysidine synthase TilS/MesJ
LKLDTTPSESSVFYLEFIRFFATYLFHWHVSFFTMHTSALVLFSGGQDSTTRLTLALSKYERVETIAFDYRQRHSVELQAQLRVLEQIKLQFPQWARKQAVDKFS